LLVVEVVVTDTEGLLAVEVELEDCAQVFLQPAVARLQNQHLH
jgi:hypothetical protein